MSGNLTTREEAEVLAHLETVPLPNLENLLEAVLDAADQEEPKMAIVGIVNALTRVGLRIVQTPGRA